ncbi:hypothetical protein JAAARDRAFT_27997 [Jaapia argillacea MUCL 33604]|uniref:Micro-fibrillar-associated protein 1 C-terminal domain-containing protein n=1 Tax=Jaapia argillacea MUCL 33604 TaxID=933084 RepID=A0A067QDZ6_9AGAM|nr:hypothetical protein JAAARDRAFT_27997 [Jaapia argillacea MUCL 33604]
MSTVLATTVPRKTAPRPAKPAARYWKGKAPKGADLPSDSEEDEAGAEEGEEFGDQEIEEVEDEDDVLLPTKPAKPSTRAINVSLKDVNISQDGKVVVGGREESGRTAMEAVSDDEDEESEEDIKPPRPGAKPESGSSSEYETDSEEEEEQKPKLQFRPVFVPKRARATIAERESIAQDTEDLLKKKELEAEERRKQSHDLVAESIKRELAEKEKEEEVPDVDDTDGLDPAGEFEAWRLRELARIKRDKEEEMARELEREEIERRRALPEEQRLKEDLERAKQTRDEKPKGQQKFLQKYWHKGAFHQDQEILKRHDYTEATESHMDVAFLPKVMQVRDFGKRSRTKYTHLLDQDTTSGGANILGGPSKGKGIDAGSGCFNCGGPHMKKDCPNPIAAQPGRGPATGANDAPTGPRRGGENGRSWRDREDAPPRYPGEQKDRPRDDGYRQRRGDSGRGYDRDREAGRDGDRRMRSRSPDRQRRSRSPPPRRDTSRDRWRDDDRRRRRSGDRSIDYGRDDKRRRVD